MPNYNIRELQLHIKEMLMAFHNICKEHDLHYYILFGTMLGAVRHKGFIPWDDDIDVGLPRPEYEMLIRHAKEWFPEPYEFICHETDENFLGGIGKMQDASTTLIERSHVKYVGGVYIDIFPLDGISSSHVAQRIQYLKYEYYKKIIYFLLRDPFKHGHGPSSWLPRLIHKTYTGKGAMRRFKQVMTRYPYDRSTWVSALNDGMTSVMPKSVIGAPTPVEFEGETVMGVENADDYLRREVGDYMQIPKEENRVSHNFHYLDLKQPYKEYLKQKGLKT